MILNLEKKLRTWREAGILSAEQTQAIRELESDSLPWAYYGLLTLGSVVVGIGVVSLVAFNWDRISDLLKLITDFGLLIGFAAALFHIQERKPRSVLFDLVLILYGFLIFASIGLISQIFNTTGELYEAVFLWCAMTAGMVFLTGSRAFIHLWTAGLVFALLAWATDVESLKRDTALRTVLVVLPAVFLACGMMLLRFGNEKLKLPGRAALFWSVLTFAGTGIFLAISNENRGYLKVETFAPLYAACALAFVLMIAGVFAMRNRRLAGTVALMGAGVVYLAAAAPFAAMLESKVLNAALFILQWLLTAAFFAVLGNRRAFDFFLVGVGIRFVIIYFQVFGDMAVTGMGLIISGLLIMGTAFAYIKLRHRLAGWMRGSRP